MTQHSHAEPASRLASGGWDPIPREAAEMATDPALEAATSPNQPPRSADPRWILAQLLGRYGTARRLFVQHDAVCQHQVECMKCTQLLQDLGAAADELDAWALELTVGDLDTWAARVIDRQPSHDPERVLTACRVMTSGGPGLAIARAFVASSARLIAEHVDAGALVIARTEAERDDLLERAHLALEALPASIEMEEGAARAFAELRDTAAALRDALAASTPTPIDVQ